MATLPAGWGDNPPLVVYGDLARAAELAGIELTSPEDFRVVDANIAETGRVVVKTPAIVQLAWYSDPDRYAEGTGWSPLDVDGFVELVVRHHPVGGAIHWGPDLLTVLEGRFSEERLKEALGEPEDGVWEDALGSGEQMSLVDGRLVVARTVARSAAHPDEDLTGFRARLDRGSLADDPVLSELAAALDGQDVYSAMLLGAPLFRDFSATSCEGLLPEEPLGVASGIADDGDGPVIVLAAVHDSPDAATTNADALEVLVQTTDAGNHRPWREQVQVDAITTDGNVTAARLRLTDEANAALWQDVFDDITPLLRAC